MADNVTSETQEDPETQFNQSFPQILLGAVEAHFVAKHSRAVENLNNYLQHTVGICEHPDIVAECAKLFEDLSAAEGALESIRKILS